MIDLGTLAGLHEHRHRLDAYCPRYYRWTCVMRFVLHLRTLCQLHCRRITQFVDCRRDLRHESSGTGERRTMIYFSTLAGLAPPRARRLLPALRPLARTAARQFGRPRTGRAGSPCYLSRFPNPARPSRPEPRSSSAAGSGTGMAAAAA